jgi:alcohol dehydrogenase class IV
MGFDFTTAGRVVFGAGRAAAELAPLVAGLGTRPLVCTGAHPDRQAALIATLPAPHAVFPVAGEPTVDVLRAALAAAREHGADVVVGLGGGSPVDVAKAVAVLLRNAGDPVDFLPVPGPARGLTRPGVPCVAVPTTAGTGSEVTANSVFAVPEQRVKVSIRSPLMLPTVAVVDPVLTLGCPPAATASSGLDALTQCLEPFVSVKANPVTDGLAREGLRRAARGLRRAYADGADLDARTDLAICALLGGMALANAKLGAVHGFASVVCGLVDVPHGMACAALLVPVVEANVRAGAAPERYREAARLLTGRPDATVADGVAWLRETVELLRVPRLGAFGLRPEQAGEVVAKTMTASSTQGNPVVLAEERLRTILAEATGPVVE